MDRVTGYVQHITGGRLEVDCALVARGDVADGVRIRFTSAADESVYSGVMLLSDIGVLRANINMKTRSGSVEEKLKLVVQTMLTCSNLMSGNDYGDVKITAREINRDGKRDMIYLISWASVLSPWRLPLEVLLDNAQFAVEPATKLATEPTAKLVTEPTSG